MSAISVQGGYQSARYGAIELKQSYQRHWYIALCLAASLHFAAVASFYLHQLLHNEAPPVAIFPKVTPAILGPPPSISGARSMPAIEVAEPRIKPKVGIPVPVPDPAVDPEQTLARNSELNPTVASGGDAPGARAESQAIEPDDIAPPIFRVVEKLPVPIKRVRPSYPELAIRAGLEGRVILNMWVDKEGRVRQVVLLKSDAEIFELPAMEAAKQWVFTPAYTNNGAVAVWVSVPFTFALVERNGTKP